MDKQTATMTHGPLGRQILAFSVPLMLSYVMQVLFNMADIAVVGRFAGPEALGAVGSTAIRTASRVFLFSAAYSSR